MRWFIIFFCFFSLYRNFLSVVARPPSIALETTSTTSITTCVSHTVPTITNLSKSSASIDIQSEFRDEYHVFLITRGPEIISAATAEENIIPGLVTETCNGGISGEGPPCVATCKENDSACRSAASSIVSTCKPQWDLFESIRRQLEPTPASGAWSLVTTTNLYSFSGSFHTTTWSVYTKFSTVSNYSYVNVYGSTITPLYALGKPSITESKVPNPTFAVTYLTGPTPKCRYNYVAWTADGTVEHLNSQTITLTCGQCSLHGGEVQLFWWPSPSTVSAGSITKSPSDLVTTVVDGMTLTSPTVYVSMHNLSASDSCSVVGRTIISTLIAMEPTDISTLVHTGGKAGQTAANQYGLLNFTQLTGLPPASAYEQQGDCIYAGCPTIYPTPINYTIVVPSQVRSMDPAWAGCAAGLEGLYDPPIALRAQPTMNPPQLPSVASATKTWIIMSTTEVAKGDPTKSLGQILETGLETSTGIISPSTSEQHSSQAAATHSSGAYTTLPTSPESQATISDPRSKATKSFPGGRTTADGASISLASTRLPVSPSRLASRSHIADSPPTMGSLQISTDRSGRYIVNGHTFTPGMELTMNNGGNPVTFEMLTTGTHTYIAIGTSITVPLGGKLERERFSIGQPSALEFTQAPDGDFVLHGTTLIPGTPIVIGTGACKTTLMMTSVHHTPAIIIDGTITQKLRHEEANSTSTAPSLLPEITSAPLPDTTAGVSHSQTGPSRTTSGSGTVAGGLVLCRILILLAFISLAVIY